MARSKTEDFPEIAQIIDRIRIVLVHREMEKAKGRRKGYRGYPPR